MAGANPEVKLALAAERSLRRPAAQLRALLAAAERGALAETPLEGLLAGPDLAVLAGLLQALPEGGVPPWTARRARGGAMNPAAGERARQLLPTDRPGSERGESRAPRSHEEIRRPRLAADADPAPRPARVLPLPSAAEHAPDRPGIADRRAALRRAVAALPAGAAPPGQAPGDGLPRPPTAAPHPLVAAAGRAVSLAAAAAQAAGTLAEEAGLDAPARAVPQAARPAASQRPGDAAGPPARIGRDGAPTPLFPFPDNAGLAAVAPRALDHWPSLPARRARPAAPPALDDGGEALAEAAWRNGVDGP